MIRRVLAGMLVVTLASLSLPSAASAGETGKQVPTSDPLATAIARAAAAEAKAVERPRLQQAQGGQSQTAPQSGGGLSSGAKLGIAAAIVVAAVATGIAVAKGPDPRPWP